MFRFDSGGYDHADSRTRTHRREAQERWPFLTDSDLSGIRDEQQLISMIASRSGIPEALARRNVQAWLQVNEI